MLKEIEINVINSIAEEAGKIILDVYINEDFSDIVDYKADDSPLTIADKRSHRYISDKLKVAYPHIPLISEEGKDIDYDKRKDWEYFWLVDPLDGTKEFIKRNGEFTVNIALIHRNRPVLGVIYTPAKQELFYAIKGEGAFKKTKEDEIISLQVNNSKKNPVGVRSRSHSAPEEMELFHKYNVKEFVSIGSSLKFCLVAEGKADIYYRHKPTMEWDTAAGQVLVEASGGAVYKGTSTEVFTYNKESLKNEGFLCLGFDR